MAIRVETDKGLDVQMTSMIDCIFLLIIFFLVSSQMKKVEKELPVNLPDSAAALNVKAAPDMIVVGIDNNGSFYIGGEPVGYEALQTKLREAAAANPDRRIRIDGDESAPFSSLVHIFDICQFEGLTNVGINTRVERGR